MKQTKLRTLILAAMFAALTCVATMIIHIPSPIGGYFNLGDCMVLAQCLRARSGLGAQRQAVSAPRWPTSSAAISSTLPAHWSSRL